MKFTNTLLVLAFLFLHATVAVHARVSRLKDAAGHRNHVGAHRYLSKAKKSKKSAGKKSGKKSKVSFETNAGA